MRALSKLRNREVVEPLVLLALGGLVLTWFGGPGVLLSVDSFFVLRPEIAVHDALSAWSSTTSAGVPNFAIHTLPFYALFSFLVNLGGVRAAEIIVLWGLISASALGARAFLCSLFDEQSSYGRWLIICGAVLYTFNPFTTSFVWWHRMWIEFTWATFPWLCAWLLRVARGQMNSRSAAAAGAIVLVLAAPGYPHVLLVPLFIFVLALFGFLLWGAREQKSTVRSAGFVAFWWFVAIAWWIVPSTVLLEDTLSSWHAQYRGIPEEMLVYGSQQASLSNVVRLIGLLQLHLNFAGQPLFPWFTAFERHAGLLLYSFPLLTGLGAFALLRLRSENPWRYGILLLLVATYLICTFLMKGGHEPLATVNKALLKLPLGAAWQHPYDKFALPAILSAVALSFYGLVTIARLLPEKMRFSVPALCALVVFVEGFPAYTGSLITPQSDVIPGGVAIVPPYYSDLQRQLAGVRGFTLQLPLRDNGETAFFWQRGAQTNNDPVLEYFNGVNPVIRLRTGYGFADAALDEAKDALADPHRAEILSALGFGDIVLHRDWNAVYMPVNPDISTYARILDADPKGTPGAAVLHAGSSSSGIKLPISGFDEGEFTAGFDVRIDDIARDQTLFSTNNGLELRWVSPGYFALYASPIGSGDAVWVPGQRIVLRREQWRRINLTIHDHHATIMVDGVRVASGPAALDRNANGAFLGSENRYHRFRGDIADFWLMSNASFSLLSSQDPLLIRRAHHFGWNISTDSFTSGPPDKTDDVLLTGASGLKLPWRSFDASAFDVSMMARLSDVRRDQVLFADSTGTELRWVHGGYFELSDQFGGHRRVFSPLLRTVSGRWFSIAVHALDGKAEILVDDVPVARGSWFVTYHAAALFLGSANRFQPLEGAVTDVTVRSGTEPPFHVTRTTVPPSLLRFFGWRRSRGEFPSQELAHRSVGKLDLFLTPCPTSYVYTADAIARSRSIDQTLAGRFRCGHRVGVLDSPADAGPCRGIRLAQVRGEDVSGTDVRTVGTGRCLLVFNTPFAQSWTLIPNSGGARVLAHQVVNGYANGFLIETAGPASFEFRYGRQSLVWLSATLGTLVLVASLALLGTTWPRPRSNAPPGAPKTDNDV